MPSVCRWPGRMRRTPLPDLRDRGRLFGSGLSAPRDCRLPCMRRPVAIDLAGRAISPFGILRQRFQGDCVDITGVRRLSERTSIVARSIYRTARRGADRHGWSMRAVRLVLHRRFVRDRSGIPACDESSSVLMAWKRRTPSPSLPPASRKARDAPAGRRITPFRNCVGEAVSRSWQRP
jgi:hypothetical protein